MPRTADTIEDPAVGGAFGWRMAMLDLAPPVLSVLVFLAGLALLASAAQPALPDRLEALLALWPLAAVELSHFIASVIGVLLLLVAGGLWRRLDGAWWLTLALLLGGAAFSLFKALDWEEATALSLVALAMLPTRAAFFRRSRLIASLVSGPFALGVGAALALMVWLLLMSYETVAYRDELWWTVLRDADIARSLRALAGAVIVGAVTLGWAALHPHRPRRSAAVRAADIASAEAILRSAEDARGEANLLYAGDKAFVFTTGRTSFVMYRARLGHWIAMGDPVGPRAERLEALVAFHAAADAASANPVIYAASPALLPSLIDMGYAVRKIGETAVVSLPDFSLEGGARSRLRQTNNRMMRDGWRTTTIAPGAAVDWSALKAVSDAWLARHGGGEKEFSLGRFDPDYLRRFPIVAVAKADGPPVAFASLWPTPDGRSATVDLMRFGADAPPGVMDFLLIGAMEWARDAGFAELDIGMTPLAGLSAGRYAPALSKIGATVFSHAEDIYGFKGLRAYKSKFAPTWRPVFIAAPGHVSLPLALANAALLTSGGVIGLLRGGD